MDNCLLLTVSTISGAWVSNTVGLVDPGNWATNIEGGSMYCYDLLWVVTFIAQ